MSLEDSQRDDVDEVAEWMRRLVATDLDAAPLPDPQALWWKAQALRRVDRALRVRRPLNIGDRVQIVCGSFAAVGLLAWLTAAAPHLWKMPSFLATVILSGMLLGGAVIVARTSEDFES